MKGIVISSPGGPEVLKLEEVDDPTPIKDDELLIRVDATALNRADVVQRKGFYPPPPGASPLPGLECSGTVVSVGAAVSRWKPGDQVCALLSGGGYAEMVVVPAGQVLPVPQGVSLRDAASLPEVACTVWSTVFMTSHLSAGESFLCEPDVENSEGAEEDSDLGIVGDDAQDFGDGNFIPATGIEIVYVFPKNVGKVVAGEETYLLVCVKMMVHGGSSGIGTFAIQIAKYCGAKVFVTAGSEEKLAFCKNLGADVCINYKTEDFVNRVKEETGGQGVDVILDSIGASYFKKNLESLNYDGRLFIIGTMGGPVTELDLRSLFAKRLTVQAAGLRTRTTENKAQIVREVEEKVWPAVVTGKVKPIVYKTFGLSEASEAHRLMESSDHIGKILLVP